MPMEWASFKDDHLSKLSDGTILHSLLLATVGHNTLENSQIPLKIRNSTSFPILESAGLIESLQNDQWQFSGSAKVQVAMRAIELGSLQREILDSLSWQEFEEFVAGVFSSHDFLIHHRYRFSTRRRYEIDVLATHNPFLFCVDCKQFGIRLGKSSALRTAVEEQVERTKALASHFSAHQVKLNCLSWKKALFIPLLVTMLHEDITFHEKTPIVPASRLNAFLLVYQEQLDRLRVIHAEPGRQQQLVS